GTHGRGSWHLPKERDLAEEVAGAEAGHFVAVELDDGRARGNHVEDIAGLPLRDHDGCRIGPYLTRGGSEPFERRRRQEREPRNRPQELERLRRDAPRGVDAAEERP